MRARHRLIGLAAVFAAAFIAGSASAAPLRPIDQALPFVALSPGQVAQAPTCQNGLLCYTPQMIRDAYDFPHGHGGATGAGQTVVVAVAYGSPFLAADLAAFNHQFGLPGADLTIFAEQHPTGAPGTSDPRLLQKWGLETSLDVEWVHALAPAARIVLAVASTDDGSDFYEVEREVLQQYPDAILSQSFGIDESFLASQAPEALDAFDQLYAQLTLGGGTVVTASGDLGTAFVAYPASSPFTLAVGGTMGNPYPGGLWANGRYGGEQAWSEPGLGAGGGGASSVYPLLPWQAGITDTTTRAVPDVSYNAAVNGGVIIAFGGRFGVRGGTSASAPQWAAILALADDLRAQNHRGRLGLAAPYLYLLARDHSSYRQDFHDITVGANDLVLPQVPVTIPGSPATPGYDLATGLGTPDVARLIKDLAGRTALAMRLDDLSSSHGNHAGRVRFSPGG
jgi:subtilase family serine protease